MRGGLFSVGLEKRKDGSSLRERGGFVYWLPSYLFTIVSQPRAKTLARRAYMPKKKGWGVHISEYLISVLKEYFGHVILLARQ